MTTIIPPKLYPISADAFSAYGRVCRLEAGALGQALLATPVSLSGVTYVASVPELEQTPEFRAVEDLIFGGLFCECGYCNGFTTTVDTLEYHCCSEWLLLGSDAVLLLGHRWDVENAAYDFRRLEAFFVPAGTAVELYATTLHYSPCSAARNLPFRAAIVLPRGTNTPDFVSHPGHPEAQLLSEKNKWVISGDQTVDIYPLLPQLG